MGGGENDGGREGENDGGKRKKEGGKERMWKKGEGMGRGENEEREGGVGNATDVQQDSMTALCTSQEAANTSNAATAQISVPPSLPLHSAYLDPGVLQTST